MLYSQGYKGNGEGGADVGLTHQKENHRLARQVDASVTADEPRAADEPRVIQ